MKKFPFLFSILRFSRNFHFSEFSGIRSDTQFYNSASSFDWSSVTGLQFYIQIDDETVEYKIDVAYIMEQKDFPELDLTPPSENAPYFLTNHDFEIDIDSPAGGAWKSVSGQEQTLLNVIDSGSPSGYKHLEVLPAAGGIKHDITNNVDIR